jgi:hypothetical protein
MPYYLIYTPGLFINTDPYIYYYSIIKITEIGLRCGWHIVCLTTSWWFTFTHPPYTNLRELMFSKLILIFYIKIN